MFCLIDLTTIIGFINKKYNMEIIKGTKITTQAFK
jgi:hypothetical protein